MDTFLSHLAEKRAKLQKQLKKLQGELADLDKAERLYRDSGAVAESAPEPAPGYHIDLTPLPGDPLPAPTEGTIKDRVKVILDRNPGGLTSGQILNVLRISGLPNLMRESLSPQLSRLKREGEIDLDSLTALWMRVHKTESQGA